METIRQEDYTVKEMQSKVYRNHEVECSKYLVMWIKNDSSCDKHARENDWGKEQKALRGMNHESTMVHKYSLRGRFQETVQHLLAGCTILAGTEYVKRYNNALTVLSVQWGKQNEIIKERPFWHHKRYITGEVKENDKYKLLCHFECETRKQNTARRLGLTLR